MTIRKIDGVDVDADTLDGEQPAAFEDAGAAAAAVTAHGIGAKHRWAANKVLLGAGVDANPTEVDPGVDWSVKTPVADVISQPGGDLSGTTYYDALSVTAAGYLTSVMLISLIISPTASVI
ncbi:unnamed protein product [marine sediment metagenome]|uniref:Uncharacterized protein n=1 Tax=marine sediment metagenome TaxID=412755 RepID=X1TYB2_9ZZZZ